VVSHFSTQVLCHELDEEKLKTSLPRIARIFTNLFFVLIRGIRGGDFFATNCTDFTKENPRACLPRTLALAFPPGQVLHELDEAKPNWLMADSRWRMA